jgi:hypothetical protein
MRLEAATDSIMLQLIREEKLYKIIFKRNKRSLFGTEGGDAELFSRSPPLKIAAKMTVLSATTTLSCQLRTKQAP